MCFKNKSSTQKQKNKATKQKGTLFVLLYCIVCFHLWCINIIIIIIIILLRSLRPRAPAALIQLGGRSWGRSWRTSKAVLQLYYSCCIAVL